MPRTTRYEAIGAKEILSVELPGGIGVVHIRTGEVQVRTKDPVVAIEVVSDTLDTPADDGRYYEAHYDSMQETVRLVGRLPQEDGPEPGPEPEGMSAGEFVNLVTNGPGWNKADDTDEES